MRHRVVGHQRVVDPVGGGHRRRAEGHVRVGLHALRRPAARRHRRPRGAARSRRASASPTSLAAWVEIEDGRIVDAGYSGGGLMGATTVRLAKLRATFEPVPLPDLQPRPRGHRRPRSASCRPPAGAPACPAPRRVKHPPFVQFRAPTVWTTLALTIHADGTSSFEVLGASKFPRHWVYDADGKLAAKVGLADFKDWYRDAFGKHTPWGDAGLEGARHRGRDRARAPALDHDHARRAPSPRSARSRRASASSSRASRATSCSSCSTACSSVIDRRRAASPSSAPARSSASGPCSRAASAPSTLQAATDVPGRGGLARPDRPRRAARSSRKATHRRACEHASSVRRRADRHLERQLAEGAARRGSRSGSSTRSPTCCACRRRSSPTTRSRAMAFSALGYDSVHHGQGQWNGVAILSRVGIDDVTTGFDEDHVDPYEGDARLLAATCGGVRVVSVYVPNGREVGTEFYERKLEWLERAARLARRARSHPTTSSSCSATSTSRPRTATCGRPKAFEGVDPRHRARARRGARACASGAWSTCSARAYDDERAVQLLGLPARRLPRAPRHAHRPRARSRSRWPTAPAGRSSTATHARASNRPITPP